MKATLEIQIGSVTKDGEPIREGWRELAAGTVRSRFAREFGGWFEEVRIGGWQDDAGNLVREESLWVCGCAEGDAEDLRNVAQECATGIAELIDQQCTMWRIVESDYGFEEQREVASRPLSELYKSQGR